MLSYSEFLIEVELIESYIDLVESWSGTPDGHREGSRVGRHLVFVKMNHGREPGHYEAEFSVNAQASKEHANVDRHDSRAILHHVHKKISEFVRDKKPKAIHMQSWDFDRSVQAKKQKMYNHFAQHLAKQHSGRASVTQDGAGQDQASVHFDHKD